ncbi:unnamed protein product [Durusdinium trenchii]|uniref:Uncharacterized protein n=2 Tax=Durusdinium trenchii TaxID=1381693 RepID=A0ABP0KQQ6_9DINO
MGSGASLRAKRAQKQTSLEHPHSSDGISFDVLKDVQHLFREIPPSHPFLSSRTSEAIREAVPPEHNLPFRAERVTAYDADAWERRFQHLHVWVPRCKVRKVASLCVVGAQKLLLIRCINIESCYCLTCVKDLHKACNCKAGLCTPSDTTCLTGFSLK